MEKKRYVVGYESNKGFVVLRETADARVALVMKQQLAKKHAEQIVIRKRA